VRFDSHADGLMNRARRKFRVPGMMANRVSTQNPTPEAAFA